MLDVQLGLLIVGITIIFYFLLILIRGAKGSGNKLPSFDEALGSVKGARRYKPVLGDVLIGRVGKKGVYIQSNANHVLVCGTTGSGKTVALSNFIKTGIDNDYPMLIIDGKGDTGAGSILDIVSTLKGNRKLYVINLMQPKTSDKYNPFKNTSATVIKDMLINLTQWSEEHYKVNAERYIHKVIELLILADVPLSLHSIVAHMPTEKFLMLSKELSSKKLIDKETNLYNQNLAKECGAIAEGSTARFSNLIENDLGSIFDFSGIDIYTALKERAIILFILNPLLYPELSPLIGNLVIIDSKKAVANIYGSELGRTFFIMDEINVYASTSLLDLVNKSRSAGITCVLATQSLSDLDASTKNGEYFKEQIIENCNNYIVLRQNSATNSEQWANIIGTRTSMEVTYQIKSQDSGGSSTGLGSARQTREFIFHPDDIKSLVKGKAIYVNKDNNMKIKMNVEKPF